MTAGRPFLTKADEACVGNLADLDHTLHIHPEASAPVLLARALGRLDRLSDHLEMLACMTGGEDTDVTRLAYFVRPLVDEARLLVAASCTGMQGPRPEVRHG